MVKRLPFFSLFFLPLLIGCSSPFTVSEECAEEARIFPDYQGILLIPKNIAPLNFEVLEAGSCIAVQIVADKNMEWEMRTSQKRDVQIPQKTWRKILSDHIGDTLQIHIFSGDSYQKMVHYKPLQWVVSEDAIDPFVVFRHIAIWGSSKEAQQMGIYERNLESFDQRTLTEVQLVDYACMNCHHFSANRSSRMAIHFRRQHAGTLITTPDSAWMVNLSLPNGEKGVFGAFSPNERFLAFSTNQLFAMHSTQVKRLKMWSYDTDANLFVYDVQNNAILSSDALTAKGMQKTYPAWSHDGKYLYFCQSNRLPELSGDTTSLFNRIQNTHYALVRTEMPFDSVETLISKEMISGKSISFPACSPDGRFIAFSTTAFGTLDPLSTDGRLWLYDIHTQTVREVEPNLENPIVSSSSWASNSRWIVAASRRMDGIYSRPFLIHVDTLGNTAKPFVMPQKDPDIYRKQDYSYSLPELIRDAVPMHAYDIAKAVRKPAKQPNYQYHFKNLQPATPNAGKHTE